MNILNIVELLIIFLLCSFVVVLKRREVQCFVEIDNIAADNFSENNTTKIGKAFSRITKKMLTWIYGTLKNATLISEQVKHMKESCEQSKDASICIKEKFTDFDKKANDTVLYLDELHKVAKETYDSHKNIQILSNNATEYAKDTGKFVESGSKSVMESVTILTDMNQNIENVAKTSEELLHKVNVVDNMTDLITDLSSNINLLSLNASIEAARAGEAGKGFEIVASEIRRLADESKEYTKSITDSIFEMKEKTVAVEDTIKNLSIHRTQVQNSMESITNYFYNINEYINKIIKAIMEVNDKVDAGYKNSERINEFSMHVAEFFETFQTELKSVSSQIEEQFQTELSNSSCCNKMQMDVQNMLSFTSEFEALIAKKLLEHCEILADMLVNGKDSMNDIQDFCKENGISEVYITDEDGVTVLTNNNGAVGFRFPDNKEAQAYIFREILHNPSKIVTQDFTKRDIDGKYYKFVAISRKDCTGIVQAGLDIEDILHLKML